MKISRRSALHLALVAAFSSVTGSRAVAANNQIVKLSKVKVGATYPFQLANGAPALLFRTKTGVFAYQTICTHEGGMSKYLSAKKLIVCSVHNASFNPFKSGAVVTGPNGQSRQSISPLPTVKVAIKNGWVVLA
jgi:nitrite reductase/ring-hydroxylating ferredoxin subunit